MSRVLQRLRQQLDDPLFTRTGNILIPTPKAQELQLAVANAAGGYSRYGHRREFDPATYVVRSLLRSLNLLLSPWRPS